MSAVVSIARYIILSLSLIFAVAVLGLSARTTNTSILFLGGIAPFEIINLVIAPLTIVALSIILSVGAFRQNAITSMIWVEFTTLSILWAMWVVVAVFATRVINLNFPLGCTAYIRKEIRCCVVDKRVDGSPSVLPSALQPDYCYSGPGMDGLGAPYGIFHYIGNHGLCCNEPRDSGVVQVRQRCNLLPPCLPNQDVQMPPKLELQVNHQHAHLQSLQQANHQQPSLQASALQNNGVGYGVPDGMAHATSTANQTPAYPQV